MFSLTQVTTQIGHIIRRFPLSSLCLGVFWICTTTLIWVQSSYYEEPELLYNISKLMMMCALGWPLFTSVYLTHEWYGLKSLHKNIFLIALCVFLVAYYIALPGSSETFSMLWGLQYMLVTIASYLSLFLISRQHTRTTARIILTGLIIGGYYALILSIGFSLVFWGMDILLNIAIDSHWYETIWSTFFTLVGGIILLGHIPSSQNKLPAPALPFWIQNFVAYVLTPLAGMYALLLIIYIAKIIVTGNWPINEVIIWIFIFGIVLIVSTILSTPLLQGKSPSAKVQKLIRIGSVLLLIFSSVATVAIMQRVPEFGITEPRYFVIILIIFFVWSSVMYLRNPSTNLRRTISVFVVLTLLSAVGPWSASSITTRSQLSIFESRARALGMLDTNNQLVAWSGSQTPDTGTVLKIMRLKDSIYWIVNDRNEKLMNTYSNNIAFADNKDQYSVISDIEKSLNIYDIQYAFNQQKDSGIYRESKILNDSNNYAYPIKGYRLLIPQVFLQREIQTIEQSDLSMQYLGGQNTIIFKTSQGSESLSLKPFIEYIQKGGKSYFNSSEEIPFVVTGSTYSLILSRAYITISGDQLNVEYFGGIVLVK